MAHDLWLDDKCESIEEFEEGLFEFVSSDSEYPVLSYIWNEFYGSPKITPEMANEAVHELIAILKIIENQHEYTHIKKLIARLLPLFSTAYKSGKIIQGAGD
jgi:hypothetical protein